VLLMGGWRERRTRGRRKIESEFTEENRSRTKLETNRSCLTKTRTTNCNEVKAATPGKKANLRRTWARDRRIFSRSASHSSRLLPMVLASASVCWSLSADWAFSIRAAKAFCCSNKAFSRSLSACSARAAACVRGFRGHDEKQNTRLSGKPQSHRISRKLRESCLHFPIFVFDFKRRCLYLRLKPFSELGFESLGRELKVCRSCRTEAGL